MVAREQAEEVPYFVMRVAEACCRVEPFEPEHGTEALLHRSVTLLQQIVGVAVLSWPVVLYWSALTPLAVLALRVLLASAPVPPAVLKSLSLVSLVGGTCPQLGCTPAVSINPVTTITRCTLCMVSSPKKMPDQWHTQT